MNYVPDTMEKEEAGSVAYRSFSHPTLHQERWDHPPASCLLVPHSLVLGEPVGFRLVVTHGQAKGNSLSLCSLGLCRLCSPCNYSALSSLLLFLTSWEVAS